jgi:outer membrane receptor protein involved in Fe transport
MTLRSSFCLLVRLACALPALATATALANPAPEPSGSAAPAAGGADMVTTGVAKGRDRLDSATSTSALGQADIRRLGARSVGELLRALPGVFSEAPNGESIANVSIRGLPVVSSGGKFVQLQEDGLPVMEFGDIIGASSDTFLRADLNLERVESIRGGSASTFASNSPGGIINFISATGEQAGGMLMLGSGINYEQRRADFDYGGPLGETPASMSAASGARAKARAASALKGSAVASSSST